MDVVSQRTPFLPSTTTTTTTTQRSSLKDLLIWNSLFVCVLVLIGPVYLYLASINVPLSKSSNVSLAEFSEERAMIYLNELISLGPRVSHTYENIQAKFVILSQIERICSTHRRNLRCEIDIQTFTNIYSNDLDNILVRISNMSATNSSSSLLLTGHYDTVEFSSGTSDDGSGVVILLELMNNLLNDERISFSDKNLIVLLTNGEETGPEGVLSFLNSHSWSSNLFRFIYLDSMNCRERSSLIQLKSSHLLTELSSIRRPTANLLFEYVPQLIGITSDYDVYTSNSAIEGYNFGHYLDAYVYHSLLDDRQTVRRGVWQELGENLQDLIRKIFETNETMIDEEEEMIYFDLFGRYLIYCRLSSWNLVEMNLIVLIIVTNSCLIWLDNRCNHELCANPGCLYKCFSGKVVSLRLLTIVFYVLSHLMSLICSLLSSLVFSWLLSTIRPMSFYGNVWLAIFLFSFPNFLVFVSLEYCFHRIHRKFLRFWSRKSVVTFEFNYEENVSIQLVYCLLMLISIVCRSRLFYLILIWSIFVCPLNICLVVCDFVIDWNWLKISMRRKYWFWMVIVSLLFPLNHSMEMLIRLLRILIPFVSRGFQLNKYLSANEIISGFVSIPSLFLILSLLPLINRSQQFIRTICSLFVGLVIVGFIIFIREPFSNQHPKLFYAKHTSKSIYTVLKMPNRSYQVPIVSQVGLITMMTFDSLPLEPILDEFSMKTSLDFVNRKCSNVNKCSFTDSFNRTLPIQNIQILKNRNVSSRNLIIQLNHLLTFNMQISSRTDQIQFSIENNHLRPRNSTRIHLQFNSNVTLFDLNIDIKRCQLNDSPFLLLFTRFMPQMLLTGDSYCHSITDLTTILFDTKYIT